jgi:hypothetical protein
MRIKSLMAMLITITVAPVVMAAEMYVYPANGQTPDQQKADEYQCYDWAKGQTGFDPMKDSTVAAPQQQQGGAVRGAVGGAAVGVIIGDNSESAGKGAAVGALAGRARQNRANRAAEQNVQAQQSAVQANREGYNNAYKACLTGRGYTVN